MTEAAGDRRERVDILGVLVDRLDMTGALAAAAALIRSGGPAQVVTPNVDHLMRCRRGGEFARLYRDADLVVADGMPLVWASRLLGRPLPERVAGSDLMPRLCALAAEHKYPVYLMGGKPGSAETCARILPQHHPGLVVAGWNCPDFGFENDPEVNGRLIEDIRSTAPAILFVGVGSPKQDIWIYRHRQELGVPLALGIGATIDFLSGAVKRAPAFTHRIGMEWLWRLLCEPRRLWRRYLVDDLPFFWLLARQWARERFSRNPVDRKEAP